MERLNRFTSIANSKRKKWHRVKDVGRATISKSLPETILTIGKKSFAQARIINGLPFIIDEALI